jgi:uncharacterized membrane-anchored protein YhcB (DUF1043 family)
MFEVLVVMGLLLLVFIILAIPTQDQLDKEIKEVGDMLGIVCSDYKTHFADRHTWLTKTDINGIEYLECGFCGKKPKDSMG